MDSIYRFTSMGRFIELVNTQALSLVLPAIWPDPYEGFLFTAVASNQGIRKVEQALQEIAPDRGAYGAQVALLTAFRYARYGQCWSQCPENDAFWKTYKVRIEINRADVSALPGIGAYDVRYIDYFDLEDELKSLFSYPDERSIFIHSEKALLQKRNEFSHEQEVRLLTDIIRDNVVSKNPPLLELALKFERGEINDEEFIGEQSQLSRIQKQIPKIMEVSFSHASSFIRSVMMGPFATKEEEKKISRFCEERGLNYLGRSEMYTFKM